MYRRLPVYLVIDCSYSMRGDPIVMVNKGIQDLIYELHRDPMALETVWLSVITFSTGAKQIVPLTELLKYQLPQLFAKGRSDMGSALRLLITRIDQEVILGTDVRKGDWKPIIFLMTDGGASDAWKKTAKEIRNYQRAGKFTIIAAGFGNRIYGERLERISQNVLIAESPEPESFAKFLTWASTTISRSCQVGQERIDNLMDTPVPKGFTVYSVK